LGVSDIRMLDRQCVGLHTPTDVAASQTGSYYAHKILMCIQYVKTLCATFTEEWKLQGYESVI